MLDRFKVKFITMDGSRARCPFCGKTVKITKSKKLARHGFKFERSTSEFPQHEKGNWQLNGCPASGVEIPKSLQNS